MSMDLPLDEYMSRFPKTKRSMYMKGYQEAVDKQQIRNRMTLNVKKEQVCLDEEGASSERNRAIWSQDPTMMLLAGYFNAHLIKSLKPVLPSFIHGLSCEGLEDKLKTQVPLKYV